MSATTTAISTSGLVKSFVHVHWAIQVIAAPLSWLTGIAALLSAAGLVGFQRRDVG
jgi:MprA protease rhombosortase-interaction domain-containing protein